MTRAHGWTGLTGRHGGLSLLLLLCACGGTVAERDLTTPGDVTDAVRTDTIDVGGEVPAPDTLEVVADGAPDQPTILPIDVVMGEVTLGAQPVAGVCTTDDACADGWCVPDYYGGYCSSRCTLDADCSQDTVYGSVCLASPENGQTMCWKVCKTAYDCRSDQFCAGYAAIKMCVPKCQPGTCKTGRTCNVDTGSCDYVSTQCEPAPETCNGADDDCNGLTDEGCGPQPNGVSGVDALDLGTITAGGGGLTYEAKLTVPADAISLTLVALAVDNAYLMFWSLTDPNGLGLLKGSDIFHSLNRTYPGEGAAALLAPNNPSVSLLPGPYRFSLYKDGDVGPVKLTAMFKRGAAPLTGKLGLNLYFVGLSWINAASAKNDGTFQKVVQKVGNVYAQAGITLDEVTYTDIGGADGVKFAQIELSDGPDDERYQLLKLSAAHPDSPNVNVFFVADITTADDYSGYFDVLGIAGGIPGPPLFQGTNGAGVVVDLSDYHSGWMSANEKITLYSQVIAHEVGHQLGLFHSSEQSGDTHDQLADTPECTNDSNGDGFVDGYECWSSGATNLMFWSATGSVGLSSSQGWVLRRNPAVR